MFTVIDSDILDATEDYICHQTNCVTTGRAAGIARTIFHTYPHSDVYKTREKPDKPGTISICNGQPRGFRRVINMHAQYYPGAPHYGTDIRDDDEIRLHYFRMCLLRMTQELSINTSFAFPWGIGCGIARGDWGVYITVLKNFEKFIKGDVTIYKLPV